MRAGSISRAALRYLRAPFVAGVAFAGAACGSSDSNAPARDTTIVAGTPRVAATSLSYTSMPGDYIGQGESHSYGLADGSWSATGTMGPNWMDHITVRFDTPGATWWTLELQAPVGSGLRVGHKFENAHRYPFEGDGPGMDFSGSGRGCNTLTGSFEILELVKGAGEQIDRLQVHFVQHCESGTSYLEGNVAIHANPWR